MYGLKPIDTIRLNKEKLAEIYNGSDIDALEYMYPFCEGELKELCERMIALNNETTLGWGDKPASHEDSEEYYAGKWKLLNHFGIENKKGDAFAIKTQ